MKEETKLYPNRPTEIGRKLGDQLARLTEVALIEVKKKFPNHKEPCGTCAFRRGTIPNGCPETVMDALKCTLEQSADFHCHEEKGQLCAGFMICLTAGKRQVKVPWEYSHIDS